MKNYSAKHRWCFKLGSTAQNNNEDDESVWAGIFFEKSSWYGIYLQLWISAAGIWA
jgi:hypothetical protein